MVVGHWAEAEVQDRIAAWQRAVRGWCDLQGAKFARFGDNMRQVAVTEGDKVAAQIRFGYSVNYYPMGDLVACIDAVSDKAAEALALDYEKLYTVAPALRKGGANRAELVYSAKIEIGCAAFWKRGISRASPPPSKISMV